MKNYAADSLCADTDLQRRRSGFVLIYVLVLSAALISMLVLALEVVEKLQEENAAAAHRIRIENAAAQASAIAEAWFCENALSITGGVSFAQDAEPKSDPTPEMPDGIFAPLRSLYPQYEIESICYDLHYPDSFAERANAAQLSRIFPRELEDGGAERAYCIKTTVTESADSKFKSTVVLSMRIKKSASGILTARRVGSAE